MDMVNIYGLWPDLVYCVVAVGRLYTALVVKRLRMIDHANQGCQKLKIGPVTVSRAGLGPPRKKIYLFFYFIYFFFFEF